MTGFIQLSKNFYVLPGAVNTGILISGDAALLFDCCDRVTPERLSELGVTSVELICCTQHRRVNVAGAYAFVAQGSQLAAPLKERELFENTNEYWSDWRNRWHLYHHQPSSQVLASPLPVSQVAKEGQDIIWKGYTIQVIDTPGPTMGSVSYLVEVEKRKICFSGDVLYGPGQIWDIYSLQKGFGTMDYHGFLGNYRLLRQSLEKLADYHLSALVPSHGQVIHDPDAALQMTIERLDEAWRNYCEISSMNYYFPNHAEGFLNNFDLMDQAQIHERPEYIPCVSGTMSAIVSDTGAVFVVDCGSSQAVNILNEWKDQGRIKSIDGVWITHYHDDHVDALGQFYLLFHAPIMTDEHSAEILEYPQRFVLPCISHSPSPPVTGTKHGESWKWHEFTFTAFHFPGQTFYHSGLLVEGHGKRAFLAGDAFSPCGLDDYCAGNRNFLGQGKGFNFCLDLIKELKPDLIFNQHQERPFSFTERQIDYMKDVLARREELYSCILPWSHPNFGTDEWWVRTYPYEQTVASGGDMRIKVCFTNHGPDTARGETEPVLPEGWKLDRTSSLSETTIDANQEGATHAWIKVAPDADQGQYIIPFRVTWDEEYLGQIRHALVVCRACENR